ncbi:NAD-glutamate dehydrogenase [Arthrobacter sp. NyZ413]|uniref:NAD-glutamate dehydrogenase n=1 Tax=Arthrobacter sp. NyZ413 TaxID=3144669 RepID=UPI003BF92083
MADIPFPAERGKSVMPGVSEAFLAGYFAQLSEEDLHGYGAEALDAWARHHLELASAREPGRAAVGIFNELDASIVAIVADDLPYLVHSITAELGRDDSPIRLLVHPTFRVSRDEVSHALIEVDPVSSPGNGAEGKNIANEVWFAAEIGLLADSAAVAEMTDRLHHVLDDVAMVAADAAGIHSRVAEVIASTPKLPRGAVPPAEHVAGLLQWLDHGNFVFLGFEELTTADGRGPLSVRPGTGLGLLRNPEHDIPINEALTGEALRIAASGQRSTVLRHSYLDEVRLTEFAPDGEAVGALRFLGLFTPGAAHQSVLRIPIIREKVLAACETLGVPLRSHRGEELLALLEAFPREELFHTGVDGLTRLAGDMLRARVQQKPRVFLRMDEPRRLVSATVMIPRRQYSTAVRLLMEQQLRHVFKAGSVEFDVRLTGLPVVLVFFRLRTAAVAQTSLAGISDEQERALERRLVSAARPWSDGLEEAIRERFPASEASRLSASWLDAFPANYRAEHEPESAVGDIINFERFDGGGPEGSPAADPLLTVYLRPEQLPGSSGEVERAARIRLYLTRPRSLTEILPFLHDLGLEVLDQRPYEVRRPNGKDMFLYDLGVTYPSGVDPEATSGLMAEAFAAAMQGKIESDRLDALVIRDRLGWRRVAVLRGYAKYLQQLGPSNSYGFIVDTLVGNARATRALLEFFDARFAPGSEPEARAERTGTARQELLAAIDDIPVLDADRLLRTFMELVEATLRTNYFLHKGHMSFKIDVGSVAAAPLPRPEFEIWVYSPRVEGVHLRFGALARGGLRWSDRREDFRTEVLGLVKAQNVKNSVIVPTGAKGGFFPKHLADPLVNREAWFAEGLECYRIFVSGLLDVTDNLVVTDDAERVVPPEGVERYDGDDFYLVVAADKGTATFSDTANELALSYGFWLNDAFASGGSVGYDHKQMGITARGAWESVKHHFKELGIDPQEQGITVAGVGDMSGDVFGNGMLLSPHIRLVAAFDHRHIFLDPDPDPAVSFRERERLFRLPRSSWADYDPLLISAGGGVHSRGLKAIDISDEVRDCLGLDPGVRALAPQSLLQAILKAPVDLLYNGGIGTYIKASTEANAQVGDKANDSIRIDGSQVRARVVAEGGNLGVTQRGRIEAASAGVLINTDAIDNSAGVDCSDHEVNIKIFIDRMIAARKMGAAERTGLLQSMTEEVARLVLANNADQNVLLFNDRHMSPELTPGFERFMDWLEAAGGLDRDLEALPSDEELQDRLDAGKGLTAPEMSLLAAYAKIELAKELTASDFADDPWFGRVLRAYFPEQLSERFDVELDSHPLRRQIICTIVANDMINLGGITFAFRAIEETTASAAALARAFVVVREAYALQQFVDGLAELPPGMPSGHVVEATRPLRRLLDRATRWYVTHDHRDQPVEVAMKRIMPTLDLLRNRTTEFLRGSDRERANARLAHWNDAGMPPWLGRRASDLLESFSLLDISLVSEQVDEPLTTIAEMYHTVIHAFGVGILLLRITDLPRGTRWEALARASLRDDAYSAVVEITTSVMRSTPGSDLSGASAMDRIEAWERGREEHLGRIKSTFAEVTQPGRVDIASIAVALKLLRTLAQR